MIIKFNQFINEKKGLPLIVDTLSNIIYNDIEQVILTEEKKNDFTIDKVDGKIIKYKKIQINLNSKEWVSTKEERMKEGVFQQAPSISLTLFFYEENVYSVSGAVGKGSNTIEFTITIPFNFSIEKLKKHLNPKITHELLHLYHSEKSGKKYYGKDEILDINSRFLSNKMDGLMGSFFDFIYLSSSYEINARVAEIRQYLKDSSNKIEDMKDSETWTYYEYLRDFNAEDFYEELLTMKTREEVAKFIDIWYEELDDTILLFKKTYGEDIKLPKIPLSLRNKPVEFFKYWERIFHKRADTWKRKMSKGISESRSQRADGSIS